MNVYLDNEFAFGLTKTIAAELIVGQELTADEIQRLKNRESSEVVYAKALEYLANRDHSEAELRVKLARKGYEDDQIDSAMDRLKRMRYLDDRNFADAWIRNQNRFRPRSSRMLRHELKRKGISDEVIHASLADVDDEHAAFACAEGYLRRLAGLEWQKFQEKLSGYLARRGFGYDVIKPTVEAAWKTVTSDEDEH